MRYRTTEIRTTCYCLIKACIIILNTFFCFTSIDAQANSEFSIKWIQQYPSNVAGEKTSFKDRISGFVFGKKPEEFIKPFSVVAVSPNQFWILDQGLGTIIEYQNSEGEASRSIKRANREFPSLVGMALSPEGDILCTDSRLNQVFLMNKKELSAMSDSITFNQPTGIAVSQKNGEIWVVETGAHHIKVLNRKGKLLKIIGGRGLAPGTFNYPTFIWIDRAGLVYIVDSMNFRVQILDQQGNYLFSFGENGDATGHMARPKGLATDSWGNIYVADALFHVVQIFDREGNYLYSFGGQGQETGEFWMPAGIFIDQQDFIYVADSYNARIQVFKLVKN
jgi:DNA-binding beta-propeller fold protein YncE